MFIFDPTGTLAASKKQALLLSVPRQIIPSALIIEPATRGSATHNPLGEALLARQTSAGLPKRRKLVVRSPILVHPPPPHCGGIGTWAFRHSSMYSRPDAVVALAIMPRSAPNVATFRGRFVR